MWCSILHGLVPTSMRPKAVHQGAPGSEHASQRAWRVRHALHPVGAVLAKPAILALAVPLLTLSVTWRGKVGA